MRIAFTLIGGKHWLGGYNYILNLLTLLRQYQKVPLTPVLFVGDTTPKEDIAAFNNIPGLELVYTPLLDPSRRHRSLLQALLLGQDRQMTKLFQDHHIDLVFEAAQFFGWRLGIRAIAWMPDFQHRKLPHLFSRGAWWKREIGFRAQVMTQRLIMLSSEDARRTCEHYYTATRGRTKVVHFAVQRGPDILYKDARAIADFYGLPEQFFFMPNQFWRHKNHDLVLDALAILRSRGKNIVIAASGKQVDPRDPNYFPAFQKKLERLGLENNLRLLGLIPYSDIAPLMRASVALLNPSLFEGWSTTVEEAKALGTPMILSDIAVHQEQAKENAIYFARNSAESLANALDEFVQIGEVERENCANIAKEITVQRVQKFARDFAEIVQIAYGKPKHI